MYNEGDLISRVQGGGSSGHGVRLEYVNKGMETIGVKSLGRIKGVRRNLPWFDGHTERGLQ